jgi:hypothetical protein
MHFETPHYTLLSPAKINTFLPRKVRQGPFEVSLDDMYQNYIYWSKAAAEFTQREELPSRNREKKSGVRNHRFFMYTLRVCVAEAHLDLLLFRSQARSGAKVI